MKDTKVFKMDPQKPDTKKIKEAAKILKSGGVVAFPTETVYGLGAMHNKPNAVTKIYQIKNRPKNKSGRHRKIIEKPISVFISSSLIFYR